MKILVISQNFYPDMFGINDIVKSLLERGHSITVLTGLPDYATSNIPEEYKHNKNRKQNYYGANVNRVSIIPRKRGPIYRSLNYLSFAFNGYRFIKKNELDDFDVVYVWQTSPVTMAIPAIAYKSKYHKPILLYCLDIWPECIKAMGFKQNTLVYNLIKIISKYIYQKCDYIAVSSKPFLKYLNEVNDISYDKMCYLPQYASENVLKRDFAKKENNHIDFLYVGNIGKAQDMGCLINAISLIQNKDNITFHLVGSGSELENTKKLVKQHNLEDIVIFYGPKTFDESLDFYKLADACVLTLNGSNKIGDTLPGKLQTYMAAGKPIIAMINGAGKEIIESSKCGLCSKAGDYKGLAKCFDKFIYNKNEYRKCGINAREYFKKNFTQEMHFDKLEKILESVVLKYEQK